jgi:hypothetical protein
MKSSIFRPQELVENSVEKSAPSRPTASLLAPPKNAAGVQVRQISIVFSIAYEEPPRRWGLQRSPL